MSPEVHAIITELEWVRGHFPRSALEAAVRAGPEIAEPLIESLRHVVRSQGNVSDEYVLHLCAMLVLAELRETRAYRPLVDLCRLGDDAVWGLLGDVVTEQLPQVLASVAQADDSLLRDLVVDEGVGEAVRAAALHAMACSAVQGSLDRDRFRSYLGALLHGDVVPRHQDWVWEEAVAIAVNLGFVEMLPAIQRAFDEGLVRPIVMRPEEATLELVVGRVPFAPRGVERYSFIEDATAELERWRDCWEPRARVQATRQVAVKVGRNDPCPCGSGKKFKKCCGDVGSTGVRGPAAIPGDADVAQ